MTTMRQLFDLQELDLDVDRCQAELDTITARLRDDSALAKARAELAQRQESVSRLQRQQMGHSQEVQASKERVQTLEERLYGGSVRNLKELESLHEELSFAKKQATAAEEELLRLMIGLDESEEMLANGQTDLVRMEREWAQTQEALSRERTAAQERLEGHQARRRRMVAGVSASVLAQYEQLRRTRQGHAVAKVERGMCTGCRLTLPTGELQRLRTARELVTCSSCGRILFVS